MKTPGCRLIVDGPVRPKGPFECQMSYREVLERQIGDIVDDINNQKKKLACYVVESDRVGARAELRYLENALDERKRELAYYLTAEAEIASMLPLQGKERDEFIRHLMKVVREYITRKKV